MDDDLIAAHRDLPMLMPFLHLPVQSGSDRVLAAMNRQHTAADYLRLVERLRAARPDLALRPTSSSATRARPRRISPRRWRWCAQSASPRRSASNTPRAPARRRQLRQPSARKQKKTGACTNCRRCCATQQARFNAGCVGLTLPVLFTGPGRHPGQIAGRSPFLQPVHLTGPASLIGTETVVQIAAAHPNSLVRNPDEERACA